MTVHDRLATIPNIKRARRQDAERAASHGGRVDELLARQQSAIAKLERRVAELEKAA